MTESWCSNNDGCRTMSLLHGSAQLAAGWPLSPQVIAMVRTASMRWMTRLSQVPPLPPPRKLGLVFRTRAAGSQQHPAPGTRSSQGAQGRAPSGRDIPASPAAEEGGER